jgi:Ser/Thr protein kinase RdoA (MazF antagonist)
MVPAEVAHAWGWDGAHGADGAHGGPIEIAELTGGLINATYAVQRGGEPIAVLQRLHPVFGAQVNLDIEAVTAHLAARGLITPRLVRTLDGRAWHEHAGRVWRALSWVDGTTVHAVPDPSWAEAGGALVGAFHRAVADLSHDYAFARAGVHDTRAHLARLAGCVAAGGDAGAAGAADAADAADLGREILDAARGLPELPDIPRRHCHGDLKISNLRFAASPVRGICLVDLDTVGLSTLAFELGDAMRSWCNPDGEDAGRFEFDLAIFAAAIRGFGAVAEPVVTTDEKIAIVLGLEAVCLELAARFAVDVFRDEYFGWDPARFASRRAHNLVRARGQLHLGLSVRAARSDALDVVRGAMPGGA